MMKKLQVMIEDEMMKHLKQYALDKDTSLKDIVTAALDTYFSGPTTPTMTKHKAKETPKPTPKPVLKEVRQPEPVELVKEPVRLAVEPSYTSPYPNPLDYEPTDEDLYYILRKTAKTKLINQYAQFQYGPIFWMVLDGCKAHYDKDGEPIPYRFTDQNGKVQEPDAEQLAELKELLGKPVKIEK